MQELALVVGLFNFIVEYILLMAVDRLSSYPTPIWKKAVVAAVSGVQGGLCLMPGFAFLGRSLWRWCVLAGLGLFLYLRGGKKLARLAIMLLLNFGVEGFQQFASQNQLLSFAAAGVMVAMICVLCFRDSTSQRYLSVELRYADVKLDITALADTGNTLRDPVTGEGVLIVSHKVAHQLTGLTRQQLVRPLETLTAQPIPGLRLIPYHCVGCDNGMLLALRLPGCKIGGKEKDLLVAFAPAGLGKEGSFQALAGGVL